MQEAITKTEFLIDTVNRVRAERTEFFIKVKVFENDECIDLVWMSPKLIKEHQKKYGEDSFRNKLSDFS